MLNDIYGTLFVVCILIVVIGGFEMILSFGNVNRMERGKRRIWYAIKGFAIILCSWLIINTLLWLIGAKNQGDWWTMNL